jgi:hypothetical protein
VLDHLGCESLQSPVEIRVVDADVVQFGQLLLGLVLFVQGVFPVPWQS